MVICLERGADCLHNGLADATAISKPYHLLPHLNQVPAYPCYPGKEAFKRV